MSDAIEELKKGLFGVVLFAEKNRSVERVVDSWDEKYDVILKKDLMEEKDWLRKQLEKEFVVIRKKDFDKLVEHMKKYNPYPADGATHTDSWVTLSWSPGISAISHDVYFGDDRDNVDTGTGETFKGNQTETWFNVGSVRSPYLVPGTMYYWRIDEINTAGTTYKGNIWSFSRSP